jgi:hypothetical protein
MILEDDQIGGETAGLGERCTGFCTGTAVKMSEDPCMSLAR